MSVQATEQVARVVRVIVADDEPRARKALKVLLSAVTVGPSGNSGLRVHVIGEAANGQEAVQLSAERHPDVVVMDLHMPVMDGLQATRAIKRQSPGVRVVVLTIYDDQRQTVLAVGADAFLLKGCAVDALLAAVLGEPDPQLATA